VLIPASCDVSDVDKLLQSFTIPYHNKNVGLPIFEVIASRFYFTVAHCAGFVFS